MILHPFFSLFTAVLFTRTIIALSAHHWLIIWIALELNIISFIPIISSSSWFQESEAALKYLLFQALGSVLLLMGAINPICQLITLLGLLIKRGVAPFHFWFPSVIKRIPWPTAALLITWQKVAPLRITLSFFPSIPDILIIVGLIRAIIGALGGLNQTHLRSLLAYSSIGHIGWIISAARVSPSIALLYLAIYIFISLPTIWVSFKAGVTQLKKTFGLIKQDYIQILLPLLLSLGGLPPMLGFIPKILVLSSIAPAPRLILILASLINLSYYLNFLFIAYLNQASGKRKEISTPIPLSLLTTTAVSPLPLGLLLLFFF